MDFQLQVDIGSPSSRLAHHDRLLLLGSCFTEHISSRMEQGGMQLLSNPHGILFNPQSVVHSLHAYLKKKQYTPDDLFYLNEAWHCWDFHSRFSATDPNAALGDMNRSVAQAASSLPKTEWLFLTLGSAFQYYTTAEAPGAKEAGRAVANCHRAPAQWFRKELLTVETIVTAMEDVLRQVLNANPRLKVVFTISPVRHIRDGVVQNNRSKARLIEAVHQLCERLDPCFYFPAYEIVMDVLRDYRFFDADMVHPNYAATQYVWEQFLQHWMSAETQQIIPLFQELNQARRHRPRFPETEAHRRFRQAYHQKAIALQKAYPYASLEETIGYFAE